MLPLRWFSKATAPAATSESLLRFLPLCVLGFLTCGDWQVDPFTSQGIMVSNHFSVYGVDPLQPRHTFGVPNSFSSDWRYQSGATSVSDLITTNARCRLQE